MGQWGSGEEETRPAPSWVARPEVASPAAQGPSDLCQQQQEKVTSSPDSGNFPGLWEGSMALNLKLWGGSSRGPRAGVFVLASLLSGGRAGSALNPRGKAWSGGGDTGTGAGGLGAAGLSKLTSALGRMWVSPLPSEPSMALVPSKSAGVPCLLGTHRPRVSPRSQACMTATRALCHSRDSQFPPRPGFSQLCSQTPSQPLCLSEGHPRRFHPSSAMPALCAPQVSSC